MENEQIRNLRMNLGKFLHDYYIKFGEDKYENFVERMGISMSNTYGEPFSSDNLRIMEAEYVTFNTKLKEEDKSKWAKATS
jgi:predicted translin family RNA/ssDNA-binding protein